LGERLWDIIGESVALFLRRISDETGSGKAASRQSLPSEP